ncbi:MAG: hypothetical protein Ct9H300mP1_03990 [Planctomycetaceae bacterium]|nr:MAG: hypothetical protein Ct9H300mP1_03990 [Planctomycetaceae bacterium]
MSRQTSERMRTLFSPIPPVNTTASAPPSTAICDAKGPRMARAKWSTASAAPECPSAAGPLEIPQVTAETTQAQKSAPGCQIIEKFLESLAGGSHQDRQRERIEIADPVVVRQSALRTHSHARGPGDTAINRRQRTAASQVTRNDLQILLAGQFGHSGGNVTVAGSVVPPTA